MRLIKLFEDHKLNLTELQHYLWNLSASEIHDELGFEVWEYYDLKKVYLEINVRFFHFKVRLD